MCNPYRGRVCMGVAYSGGGTRFARLPPVIEIIPRSGYITLRADAMSVGASCRGISPVALYAKESMHPAYSPHYVFYEEKQVSSRAVGVSPPTTLFSIAVFYEIIRSRNRILRLILFLL